MLAPHCVDYIVWSLLMFSQNISVFNHVPDQWIANVLLLLFLCVRGYAWEEVVLGNGIPCVLSGESFLEK